MWLQVLFSVIALLYLYLRYVYSYWDRVGIPNFKPIIPFGNLRPVAKKERSFGMTICDLYNKTTEPFIGIYLFFRPAILVRDPEIVHKVLISDFSSFHDRGVFCDEKRDPFSGNLFALPGEKWRILRNQITPTMTSGKIRAMYETITNVANNLFDHLKPLAEQNQVIDIKNIATKYSLDIVANVFFGLDVSTLTNPDDEFGKAHTQLAKPSAFGALRVACNFLCPDLLKFFRMKGNTPFVRTWMMNIIKDTIEAREKHNFIRKDFMQLLIQLRNMGKIGDDDNWEINQNKKLKELKFSIEQCGGQVFILFIAGTETSSSAISFCLHELSQQPELMAKLQGEIDQALLKTNGEITYEMINELKFLDLCFQETLRKYPGLPILNRICTKDYEDSESNFKIKKGTSVLIPLYGIQRDPLYYNEPDKFNPYRFDETHPDYCLNEKHYLPFGDGPHICIGIRVAKVVTKVALIKMITNYHFEKTFDGDPEFASDTVPIVAKDGIKLKISKR